MQSKKKPEILGLGTYQLANVLALNMSYWNVSKYYQCPGWQCGHTEFSNHRKSLFRPLIGHWYGVVLLLWCSGASGDTTLGRGFTLLLSSVHQLQVLDWVARYHCTSDTAITQHPEIHFVRSFSSNSKPPALSRGILH